MAAAASVSLIRLSTPFLSARLPVSGPGPELAAVRRARRDQSRPVARDPARPRLAIVGLPQEQR
jgi:hypothetical protein